MGNRNDENLAAGTPSVAFRHYQRTRNATEGVPYQSLRTAIKGDTATVGFRVGIGHDTHRLQSGGTLKLGGVEIPHDCSLVGHSDADILLHAITDAVLGAAGLGDIGELFPDTDAANRGRDSGEMLRLAWQRVTQAGYALVNLDCIIFAQRPKLSAYKDPIRRRVAELLRVSPEQIGVKAKTGEKVDAVGREEAMMAQCVALLTTTL